MVMAVQVYSSRFLMHTMTMYDININMTRVRLMSNKYLGV